MVKDKSLDRFKKVQIPQHKVDSANEISKMEDFKQLKKVNITKQQHSIEKESPLLGSNFVHIGRQPVLNLKNQN